VWRRFRRWVGRPFTWLAGHDGRDFLLAAATILIFVAGGFAIADAIYSDQSGSFFWNSVAFANIASISTAVAAAAACVSAWLARKPRSDTNAGYSDAEYRSMHDAMELRATKKLSREEFSEVLDTVVRLRHGTAEEKHALPSNTEGSDAADLHSSGEPIDFYRRRYLLGLVAESEAGEQEAVQTDSAPSE